MESNIYFKDCIEGLQMLEDNSVDLFLQDPPYGTTQNKWDKAPDLETLWPIWLQKAKPNAVFVFTSAQPFTSHLILSNPKMFKYELIWEKSIATQFLNAHKRPMPNHENIIIFHGPKSTYNPQKTLGAKAKKTISSGPSDNYGKYEKHKYDNQTGERMPKSVLFFPNDLERHNGKGTIHPTQKPLSLFRWLILSYSNPGGLVVDCYSGSGTTACAAYLENRNFVCFENNQDYFQKSISRLEQSKNNLTLF